MSTKDIRQLVTTPTHAIVSDGTAEASNVGYRPLGDFKANLGLGTSLTQTANNGNGTAGTPAFAFVGDENTGIYRPGADALGFVTNGSEKVRITSAGNVGIGTTAPTVPLSVNAPVSAGNIVEAAFFTQNNSLDPTTGAGSRILIGSINNTGRCGAIEAVVSSGINGHHLAFLTNAEAANPTEKMRITSAGNVGIGTNAPATRLHVQGGITIQGNQTIVASTNDTGFSLAGGTAVGTGGQINLRGASAGFNPGGLELVTNNTERMRIDSAGNVGIGTSSPAAKLVVAGGSAGNSIIVGGNVSGTLELWEGNGVSGNADTTRLGVGRNNTALLFTNNSGTPRTAFAIGTTAAEPLVLSTNNTERLRIDSAGNVGIGTSSPSSILDIVSGAERLRVIGATEINQNTATGLLISATNAAGTVRVATAGVERMRITSAGNVGIGTSSPDANLTVNGAASFAAGTAAAPSIARAGDLNTGIFFPAADTIAFSEGGAEAMRIDSSGNLLVGTTVQPTGVTGGAGFIRLGSARSTLYTASTSTSSAGLVVFLNPNGEVGSISTSGSATTYATSSDYRLKHDIQPMTGALAKVAQLKPVTYKWNADDSQSQGFIAHELQEVAPECVTGEKDAVDADGKPVYQGIDTSFLVATLTAAIQEQQAIINDLKARLDAANL